MPQNLIGVESPVEIFQQVFLTLKPRTAMPEMRIEFRRFANANSFIQLEEGRLSVRITDVLETAPAPILEALAFILLAKLYRRPLPAEYSKRYRSYLNRKDMRHALHLIRQTRGHKLASAPQGACYDLEEIFDDLNFAYFFGLMTRPNLGWSLRASRVTLGHYDPSHNTIILSKLLDSPGVQKLIVEYVMFHEMLHLRHPVEHRGSRRCVHTLEFKAAEREFPSYQEAKELLKKL